MEMNGKPTVRITGPASRTIRNTVQQLLKLAGDGELKTMQLQLAAGVMLDVADQVERLERMAVPESQKARTSDLESGKVLAFEACKQLTLAGAGTAPARRGVLLGDEMSPARRLALGGAVSATVRRRGLWNRFQTMLRRL